MLSSQQQSWWVTTIVKGNKRAVLLLSSPAWTALRATFITFSGYSFFLLVLPLLFWDYCWMTHLIIYYFTYWDYCNIKTQHFFCSRHRPGRLCNLDCIPWSGKTTKSKYRSNAQAAIFFVMFDEAIQLLRTSMYLPCSSSYAPSPWGFVLICWERSEQAVNPSPGGVVFEIS